MRASMRRLRSVGVALVVAFALQRAASGLDLARTRLALVALGPFVPFLLLPYLLATGLDAWGSRLLLGRLPRPPRLLDMIGVRLMVEAVGQSLPTGPLLAEGLTPRLLRNHCGIPWSEGIANAAVRKALLFAAQSFFLALAAGCCALTLANRPWARGLAVGASLIAASLLLLLRGLRSAAARGSLTTRLLAATRFLPSRLARLWVARRRITLREVDLQLRRILTRGETEPGIGSAFAAYCAMSAVESLEAYCLLRILGSPLGLAEALPLEAMVSWLRAVAFFVPAGLGVQDLGAVALLQVAGIPDAAGIGAGWALLRRAREAFWVGVGYSLLAHARRAPSS